MTAAPQQSTRAEADRTRALVLVRFLVRVGGSSSALVIGIESVTVPIVDGYFWVDDERATINQVTANQHEQSLTRRHSHKGRKWVAFYWNEALLSWYYVVIDSGRFEEGLRFHIGPPGKRDHGLSMTLRMPVTLKKTEGGTYLLRSNTVWSNNFPLKL